MVPSAAITAGVRALEALAPAVETLEAETPERRMVAAAAERGYFRPAEEAQVRAWFARLLTVRAALHGTIRDLAPLARSAGADEGDRLRSFVVGYAAACLLVRQARFLVFELAVQEVVRRKLDEAAPAYRIPRKQYTRIYRSMTSPRNAWRLARAIDEADRRRADIERLRDDPALARVLDALDDAERAVRVNVSDYLKARLRYRWHSWRRRRASALQQALFALAEASGRVIADLRTPGHRDRVTPAVRDRVAALLRAGDVIVTRHDNALSNLFLPGFWPHAALYVGPGTERDALGVLVDAGCAGRWIEPRRVLEARKDGVRLRSLDDTLAVDAFAVIRPRADPGGIAAALTSALSHEGKLYNFDFDFFSDDRLVCTEVVYRAYEGIGDIAFDLRERAGRLTISAEDLLDCAADNRGFETVAVFGARGSRRRLVTGAKAHRAAAELSEGP